LITGSVGATDREGDALSYSVTDTQNTARRSIRMHFTYTQTRPGPRSGWPDDFVITVSDTAGCISSCSGRAQHGGDHQRHRDTYNHAPTITVTPSSTDPSNGSVTYTVATPSRRRPPHRDHVNAGARHPRRQSRRHLHLQHPTRVRTMSAAVDAGTDSIIFTSATPGAQHSKSATCPSLRQPEPHDLGVAA